MKTKILLLIAAAAFCGCSFNGFMGDDTNKNVVIQKVDKDDLREVMKKEKMIYAQPTETTFRAQGEGIAPQNSVSYAQSVTLAKRAAENQLRRYRTGRYAARFVDHFKSARLG